MDKIKDLVSNNKSEFIEKYKSAENEIGETSETSFILGRILSFNLDSNFAKDLIDAVIEDEEKETKKADKFVPFQRIHYVDAKQDTIKKLKAIKELL
jgi:glycyl-tRNA synthetase beta subunit